MGLWDLWMARMDSTEILEEITSLFISVDRRLNTESTGDDNTTFGTWSYSLSGQNSYEALAIMILFIILVVLAVHHFFDWLHEVLFDSSYHKILPSIERELMIIGLVAFVFRILTNLYIEGVLHIDHYAMEFAELLVPMITFGNVCNVLCVIAIWVHA